MQVKKKDAGIRVVKIIHLLAHTEHQTCVQCTANWCAPGDLRTQADAYLQLQHNCNTIEYSRKIISFVFLLKWCRKIATRIIM